MMSLLAKTSIFLAGSLAGSLFAVALMGSAEASNQPAGGINPAVNPAVLGRGSTPNCAPGFSVTKVWGSPVANPTPTTPSYGWTCITPVVHCIGAPAVLSAQVTQGGNGFGRISYNCTWIRFG